MGIATAFDVARCGGQVGVAGVTDDFERDLVTTTDLPRLLDITQIADHLGVSVRHIRRLVAERRIPYVKWGHLIRFDPAEVSRWLHDARIDGISTTGRR